MEQKRANQIDILLVSIGSIKFFFFDAPMFGFFIRVHWQLKSDS
jgi:hypothetical protein